MPNERHTRARSKLSGGSVRIRPATEADRETIRRLCFKAHEESSIRQFSIVPDRVDAVLDHILSPKTVDIGMVAEATKDGQSRIVGLLHATAAPHLYLDLIHSNCLLLYVTPEARHTLAAYKLVRHFIRRSVNSGAQSMSIHVSSGGRIAQTDRFLKKMGFDFLGGNYQLVVKSKPNTA